MKNDIVITLALTLSLTACTNPITRDGERGNAGRAGSSCSVLNLPENNGVLISCTDGTSARVTNGSPGMDAMPVSTVQLCPNINESEFPEVAFLIDNKLYVVYSSGNKASLALLVPGTYTTTAPGQNCTFTVQADGVTVTN